MCEGRKPGAPLQYADVLIVEYEQLKEEQRLRIISRDNLMYATLVVIGAVAGAAFQAKTVTVLLLLPAVCLILGWTYVLNDRKISQIGRHIRNSLTSHVSSELSASATPFAWEAVHRREAGYRRNKIIQVSMTLLTFCGPGLAAIVANLTTAPITPLSMVLIVLGVIGTTLLAQQVLANADLRS